ncbi:MAG: hypothetical protein HC877_20680 [Thioploca sp.]|nr:hypothetical protein [Thioploca sp.]
MVLTADRAGRFFESHDNLIFEAPLQNAAVVFRGGLVCQDPSDGYFVAASDSANFRFAGVCVGSKAYDGSLNNTAGADADIVALVKRRGRVLLTVSSGTLSQANVGTPAYIATDDTFNLAAVTTNDVLVGVIDEIVSTTMAWIAFDVTNTRINVATEVDT